jgi:hypothetical protein
MIANIASDDALILPHHANPVGLNFRERQGLHGRASRLRCPEVFRPAVGPNHGERSQDVTRGVPTLHGSYAIVPKAHVQLPSLA